MTSGSLCPPKRLAYWVTRRQSIPTLASTSQASSSPRLPFSRLDRDISTGYPHLAAMSTSSFPLASDSRKATVQQWHFPISFYIAQEKKRSLTRVNAETPCARPSLAFHAASHALLPRRYRAAAPRCNAARRGSSRSCDREHVRRLHRVCIRHQ